MNVTEGRQIATATCRRGQTRKPKDVTTTHCPVVTSTECRQVEPVDCVAVRMADCAVVEAEKHPAKPLTPISIPSVKPRELGTGSPLKEPTVVRAETPAGRKPLPLHTEPVEADDLLALARQAEPRNNTKAVHSVPAEPDCKPVRQAQKEMTLEELFTIGRKEEER